jgi:phosphoribosylanthranilate isomerase
MIDGIGFKVCGLTSLEDARFADRCGADYLGFNLYPKSPRYFSLAQFAALAPRVSPQKRMAVMVEPTMPELKAAQAAGFDFFQIHFRHDFAPEFIAAWSMAVGAENLWLAPKLPPGIDVGPELLPYAQSFLLDTFQANAFGGTGRTGDWPKFLRHQRAHPDKIWVLSGGLNPDNIGDALRQSGARFVDVNSGVESAPGVKDHAKLERFVAQLRGAKR